MLIQCYNNVITHHNDWIGMIEAPPEEYTSVWLAMSWTAYRHWMDHCRARYLNERRRRGTKAEIESRFQRYFEKHVNSRRRETVYYELTYDEFHEFFGGRTKMRRWITEWSNPALMDMLQPYQEREIAPLELFNGVRYIAA